MNYCTKKSLIILLAAICHISYGQFLDNFSSDTLDMKWLGARQSFMINASHQLQLNAADPGKSILYAPVVFQDSMIWECYAKLGFAPSVNNKTRIYLASGSDTLEGGDAYFVELGENGSADRIRFYESKSGTATLLASGKESGIADNPVVRIRVILHGSGKWSFETDYTGENLYLPDFEYTGSVPDLKALKYFGVWCLYTTSNKNKFYFDDINIYGKASENKEGPRILSASAADSQSIIITTDKALNMADAAQTDNFINLTDDVAIAAIDTSQGVNILVLSADKPLSGFKTYTFVAKRWKDLNGNITKNDTFEFEYIPRRKAYEYEILINEVMANPSNSPALPNVEYIELWNTGASPLLLKGMRLVIQNSEKVLPDYTLGPGAYVVLCNSTDTMLLKDYGPVIGINAMPTLANAGALVAITNEDGSPIHSISYTDEWYQNASKQNGGWSLELISPSNVCTGSADWMASIDVSGGTPGKENSVFNPDGEQTPLKLLNILPLSDRLLKVTFNKTLRDPLALNLSFYSIDPPLTISHIDFNNDLKNELLIYLNDKIQRSVIYTLITLPGLPDCKDYPADTRNELRFGLAESAEPGDIVLNEILFNERSGSVPYVELYNKSDKVIRLSDFKLCNKISHPDEYKAIALNISFNPGEYIALCPSPEKVLSAYYTPAPEHVYVSDLPSFDDDRGNISVYFLQSGQLIMIDSFDYDAKMHSPFLHSVDGVALERIDAHRATNNAANWQSASSQSGYGTPAYRNSQQPYSANYVKNHISLSGKRISPDGDGFEDFVLITATDVQPGSKVTARIYNYDGILTRSFEPQLSGSELIWKWDGYDDKLKPADIGHYLISVEVVSADGSIITNRESIAVVAKF